MAMWVEPELLSSGGDVARNAGDHVLSGAAKLSATPIGATIFGDFPAAQSFHGRLSAHHTGQVTRMQNSHHTLADVGMKAKTSARLFAETEERNRSAIDRVTDA
jgi:hypothetical protein